MPMRFVQSHTPGRTARHHARRRILQSSGGRPPPLPLPAAEPPLEEARFGSGGSVAPSRISFADLRISRISLGGTLERGGRFDGGKEGRDLSDTTRPGLLRIAHARHFRFPLVLPQDR